MIDRLKNKIVRGLFNNHTQNITSAAIMLGAAFLASRFLGLMRARLLVSTFGVGNNLDAYFAAFQIPDFAYNLLISATLGVAFIPVFCERLTKDRDDAWRIANSVLNIVMIAMGVLCFFFFIFTPQFVHIVSPGFSGERFALTVRLTRILLLSPWLFSISAVFSSILNSFRSFVLIAIAPLLYNIVIILSILFLAPSMGIYGVAVGVIVGVLAHIAVQIPGAIKFGFSWRAIIDFRNSGVREIFTLIVPRILAIDISQISGLIGTVIGSTLMVGSVTIFNLIFNIESVPIGVFAVSFVVSVFPSLSNSIAEGKFEDFRSDFSYTARQILFFLVPLMVMTFVFRAQLVRLIIGTKSLTWDETRLGAATLAIFASSFIFQGIAPLLSRAFFALKNTATPLIVSLCSVIVNVFSTYYFLSLLSHNGAFTRWIISVLKLDGLADIRVLSLPLGFAVASIFNAVVLVILLRKKVGYLDGWRICISCIKFLVAGFACGFAGYAGLYFIEQFLNTHTFVGIFLQLAFSTSSAIAVLILMSLLMRSEEMINIIKSIKRKMSKSITVMDISDTTGTL